MQQCFDYYYIFEIDKVNLIIKYYYNEVILPVFPNFWQLGLLS